MQLGHGNKKEQEEPHRLFDPEVLWKDVSCGMFIIIFLGGDFSHDSVLLYF